MTGKKCLVLFCVLFLAVSPLSAKILWQDFSLSFLSGDNYRVTDNHQKFITFEHTAETNLGDSFLFYDYSRSRHGKTSHYGEWSTRYSVGKLLGKDLAFGMISDWFVSNTLEMGNNLKNNLYGLGINLNIRPFRYFKIDYCRRYNDNAANNWQTTVVWGLPFSIGQEKFLYDGFIDKTTSNRDFAASLNFTSQLKWLLSPHLRIKNKLYLGIEYVYWDNKFGIKNTEAFKTDERNINILLKYHF